MGILYTLRAMVKEKEVPTEPPRFYIRACYKGADDGLSLQWGRNDAIYDKIGGLKEPS